MQNFQLGAQKFQQDLEKLGINTEPNMQQYPRLTKGFRQDPTSDAFIDEAGKFAGSWAGTAVGAALAPFTGGTSLWVGGAFDILGDIFSKEAYQREEIGGALKEIAEQSFGRISSDDAEGIARQIQVQTSSFEALTGGDLDMEEAQRAIQLFANQGGFTQAQDADDMARITSGLLDNLKEFADNMEVTMDEAVNIMAELEKRAIVSTDQAANLSARVESLSRRYGMNPGELLNLGVQGSEMTRGTGITNEQGFEMAISQRGMIDRMLNSDDPITRQLMLDYASPEQAALAQMRGNIGFMRTGLGRMIAGAQMGGYQGIPGAGGDINDIITGFSDYLNEDINNVIGLPIDSAFQMQNMSQPEMLANQVGTAVQYLEELGVQNPTDTAVAQIMMNQNPGLEMTDAMVMVRQAQMGIPDPEMEAGLEGLAALESEAAPRSIGEFVSGGLEYYGNEIWRRTMEATGITAIGDAAYAIGEGIETGLEDIRDNMFGIDRFRGSGVSEEVAAMMADEETLFQNAPEEVTMEYKRQDAEEFIDRYIDGVGGLADLDTALDEDMIDLFAEFRFGLSDEQSARLLEDLQDQGSGLLGIFGEDRDIEDIRGDLEFLGQAQADIDTDFGEEVQVEAYKALSGIDVPQIVQDLPEGAPLQDVYNAVAGEIAPGKTYEELTERQQDVVGSVIQQNTLLRERFEEGLDRYGVDMRFRDEEGASRVARAEQTIDIARVELGEKFEAFRESDAFKDLVSNTGLTTTQAERYFTEFEGKISQGNVENIEDLNNIIRVSRENDLDERASFYSAIKTNILQDEEGFGEVLEEGVRIRAAQSVADVGSAAMETFSEQLEEALADTPMSMEQIDLLKRGVLGKLTSAEVSGNDVTMAMRELDPQDRREMIDFYAENLSSDNIQKQKAAATAIQRIGGKIGTSKVIQELTQGGKVDEAERLRKLLNPGLSTEAVLRDLKGTIYGGAVTVRMQPKQTAPEEKVGKFEDSN